MTLNIDLEDVPFAILEAVKARILANRRRLQQDQQRPRPSLRPRPQFVKIGASSKAWRLPKPAALVLDGSVILITWRTVSPILNDSSLAEIDLVESEEAVPTLMNGVSAIAIGPGVGAGTDFRYSFFVNNSAIPRGNFTAEFYAEHITWPPPNPGSNSTFARISISEFDSGSGKFTQALMSTQLFPQKTFDGTLGQYFNAIYSAASQDSDVNSGRFSPSTASVLFHMCIQRINGRYYFYVSGKLKLESRQSDLPTSDLFSIRITGSTPFESSPVLKCGPIRITLDSARYPQAGFTPEPLPFTG